jgi:hypothetical protein
MGGTCSTYGGEERCVQALVGRPEERDHLGNPAIDGRIILNRSPGSGMESMDWIDLAQERDRWRALLNAIMNLRVPQNVGNFLTS